MIRDYIRNNGAREFTVRDILTEVFKQDTGSDVPLSYTVVYRDLEVLTEGDGYLKKERKQDVTDKQNKNFDLTDQCFITSDGSIYHKSASNAPAIHQEKGIGCACPSSPILYRTSNKGT
jgi:hypothetical protein